MRMSSLLKETHRCGLSTSLGSLHDVETTLARDTGRGAGR